MQHPKHAKNYIPFDEKYAVKVEGVDDDIAQIVELLQIVTTYNLSLKSRKKVVEFEYIQPFLLNKILPLLMFIAVHMRRDMDEWLDGIKNKKWGSDKEYMKLISVKCGFKSRVIEPPFNDFFVNNMVKTEFIDKFKKFNKQLANEFFNNRVSNLDLRESCNKLIHWNNYYYGYTEDKKLSIYLTTKDKDQKKVFVIDIEDFVWSALNYHRWDKFDSMRKNRKEWMARARYSSKKLNKEGA